MYEARDSKQGYETTNHISERSGRMVAEPVPHHVGVGDPSTSALGENMIQNPVPHHVGGGVSDPFDPFALTSCVAMIENHAADPSDVVERLDREGYGYAASSIAACRKDPDWDAAPDSEEQVAGLLKAWCKNRETDERESYKPHPRQLEVLARKCLEAGFDIQADYVFMGVSSRSGWEWQDREDACLEFIAAIIGKEAFDAVIAQFTEKKRKEIGDDYWRVYTDTATEEEKARVYAEIERKGREG
jgi:hypothetical protein